ncbi:MAG: ion transporter [Bacteroidaceae bacterium]|nr:ion transporter [Bacteroidaceae bacterium]
MILINSILIGVETYNNNETIKLVQSIILWIFTAEIIIRFIAAKDIVSFFKDGWNIFDLTLVVIGYIPETFVANASAMMALRVLRVFRVLRLLRAAKEIKLIITVLVKSMTAMFYNVILFLIFIYLFAIIGVGLFKLPNPEKLSKEQKEKYELFIEKAPNAPSNSEDPFGTLGEAMFTLFRELTGEDWTDIRYNHITAYEYGLIKTSPAIITTYHVLWFTLSAFLLLNLVTGAIINNYQLAKEEQDEARRQEKELAKANKS